MSFVCTKDGISGTILDTMNISGIQFKLRDVLEIKITERDSYVISMHLSTVLQFLKKINGPVKLEVNDADLNIFQISTIGTEDQIKVKLRMTECTIDDMSFESEFKFKISNMELSTFDKYLKTISIMSDVMKFDISEESISMSSVTKNGGDEVKIDLNVRSSNGEIEFVRGSDNEPVQFEIEFAVKILEYFMSMGTVQRKVDILLNENFPIQLCFNLSENDKVIFILCPKITEMEIE